MDISKMTKGEPTKPRGSKQGDTGGVDYLKELRKISPRWAKVLKEKGIRRAISFGSDHEVDGASLQINNHRLCIVGEAWGFTPNYNSYSTPESNCEKCEQYSYDLTHPENFSKKALGFVTHFKKEHGKK